MPQAVKIAEPANQISLASGNYKAANRAQDFFRALAAGSPDTMRIRGLTFSGCGRSGRLRARLWGPLDDELNFNR